jgi:6-phosphogluconolactonase
VTSRNLATLAAALLFSTPASGAEYLVYAGTYTSGASHGIYGYRFDSRNGKLKSLGLMAEASNPTFLAEHPDHRFLYVLSEDASNSVSAFLIDPKSGKLALVNKTSSKGGSPCHLALDRSGRWLAVANCGSGGVALLPLRTDGGLGEAQPLAAPRGSSGSPQAPAEPHPQGVLFSPDNRFLLVADQGLDRILVYKFNAETGSLVPAEPSFVPAAPGAGVRRLVFHPNGKVLYALNGKLPGVTGFRYLPASGELSLIQTVPTLPPSYAGPGAAAEIAVNAAGTMVYASDRGIDCMALLVVDPLRSTLSALEFTPLIGRTPDHFALDPAGGYLVVANRESNNLTVYTVHPHSGQLRPLARSGVNLDRPAGVVFVPVP